MSDRERKLGMADDLRRKYPHMSNPIRCENGCGVVIDIGDAMRSYKRNEQGYHLLICECCAAEEGHADEADEEHDEGPVCKRKPKVQR